LLATFDEKQLAQLEELESAATKKDVVSEGGQKTEGPDKKA
jgi:hypothetical protein